jgi:hypothetical protein
VIHCMPDSVTVRHVPRVPTLKDFFDVEIHIVLERQTNCDRSGTMRVVRTPSFLV